MPPSRSGVRFSGIGSLRFPSPLENANAPHLNSVLQDSPGKLISAKLMRQSSSPDPDLSSFFPLVPQKVATEGRANGAGGRASLRRRPSSRAQPASSKVVGNSKQADTIDQVDSDLDADGEDDWDMDSNPRDATYDPGYSPAPTPSRIRSSIKSVNRTRSQLLKRTRSIGKRLDSEVQVGRLTGNETSVDERQPNLALTSILEPDLSNRSDSKAPHFKAPTLEPISVEVKAELVASHARNIRWTAGEECALISYIIRSDHGQVDWSSINARMQMKFGANTSVEQVEERWTLVQAYLHNPSAQTRLGTLSEWSSDQLRELVNYALTAKFPTGSRVRNDVISAFRLSPSNANNRSLKGLQNRFRHITYNGLMGLQQLDLAQVTGRRPTRRMKVEEQETKSLPDRDENESKFVARMVSNNLEPEDSLFINIVLNNSTVNWKQVIKELPYLKTEQQGNRRWRAVKKRLLKSM